MMVTSIDWRCRGSDNFVAGAASARSARWFHVHAMRA